MQLCCILWKNFAIWVQVLPIKKPPSFFHKALPCSRTPTTRDFMKNAKNSKGGFSESLIRFFKSPNLQKKIFQKNILSLKFKFQAQLNFKLRIVFWNIFFFRFGDLKNETHFLKKATFSKANRLQIFPKMFEVQTLN